MIYRVVRRVGDEWHPVTKHKSNRPRLYDHVSFAKCAATLMAATSVRGEYRVEVLETASEWQIA